MNDNALNLEISTNLTSRSIVGLTASPDWRILLKHIEVIVGKRAANLFGYGIASTVDSPLCVTFFRNYFIETGEELDNIILNEAEDDLLSFGETLARHNGKASYDLFETLSPYYTNGELILLVKFAAQIVAACFFDNAFGIQENEVSPLTSI